MENELNLKEIFWTIKKRIILIIIIVILSTISAALISFFLIEPVYRSTTTLYAWNSNSEESTNSTAIGYNDLLLGQQLVKDYKEIAVSRRVLEKVISNLDLDTNKFSYGTLSSAVDVQYKNDTRLIMINVDTYSPDDSAEIANEIADVFMNEIQEIMKVENIQIIDEAIVSKSPIKPNSKMNIAIGLVLGLMISIAIAFLIEYLDNTIKTPEDVEKHLGLPVIAAIPEIEKSGGSN